MEIERENNIFLKKENKSINNFFILFIIMGI